MDNELYKVSDTHMEIIVEALEYSIFCSEMMIKNKRVSTDDTQLFMKQLEDIKNLRNSCDIDDFVIGGYENFLIYKELENYLKYLTSELYQESKATKIYKAKIKNINSILTFYESFEDFKN